MIFMAKIKIIAQPFFRETCISVSEMRSRTIPPQAEGNSPLLEVGVYTPLKGCLSAAVSWVRGLLSPEYLVRGLSRNIWSGARSRSLSPSGGD